jgi:dCMP deaminase
MPTRICDKCGNERIIGRGCAKCAQIYAADIRKKRVAAGLCITCGANNDRVNIGSMCTRCVDKNQDRCLELRAEVILGYGGQCVCCGESRLEFLQLDHKNDDGKMHRESLFGENRAGSSFYREMIKQEFPDSIQILCANCHLAKTSYGQCLHVNQPKQISRYSWDEYFMRLAKVVATRSTCPRLSVGAVIVKDRRILSSGYNGSGPKLDHCIDVGCLIENNHCIRTTHAELNAITQAAFTGLSPTVGSTIYVTHSPCIECFKTIYQAGISRVVYGKPYRLIDYKSILAAKDGLLPVVEHCDIE